MATKNPLVSIVILNWNGLEDTKLCLDSVKKLTYKNVEVIVVDNGSSQDQKDYLSKTKGILYVDNPVNRGFTGGHIDGYSHTKGEFVLLLNNDAVIDSDYISKALPLFEDLQVGAVGGKAYFWNDDEPLFCKTNRFYSYMTLEPKTGETTLQVEDDSMVQEVNSVSGAAFMVRRSAIKKIGYLHNEFFAYYEETDLIARMKRAGYKVLYSPTLHIWHKNGASSGAQDGSAFFYYHIFRNRYIFAMRNFEQPFLRSFRRNYFSLGIKSALRSFRGDAQKRLGVAYLKAMWYVVHNHFKLVKERRELENAHGRSTYCEQILKEQIKFSVIAKGNSHTHKPDDNPWHEYINVTNNPGASEYLSGNTRFVIDHGYFDANPMTLGCLAARMPWIVIVTKKAPINPDDIISTIYIAQKKKKTVIALDESLDTVIMTKKYFQMLGGFHQGGDTTDENIARIVKLAKLDKQLLDNEVRIESDSTEKSTLKRKLAYYHLARHRNKSSWEQFLEHHYRVFQLRNFTVWALSPRVPIRLKLGRIRNLLKFSVTLKPKLIAHELRIINDERQILHNNTPQLDIKNYSSKRFAETLSATKAKPNDIPVFIICYQRVEPLKKLVAWLESVGLHKIVFLDNNSSYLPLKEYYDSSPYQKLLLYRNMGHTAPWNLDVIRTLIPDDFYIVSDPDVLPVDYCPDDAVSHLIDLHDQHRAYIKIGLGLKIDDLPKHYTLRDSVKEWESQFWKTKVGDGVFEAGVDTTFALYKPYSYDYVLHPSLRTDEPYVARHEPWYKNPKKPSEEDLYYRKLANSNITSWSSDELPERYKKEMKRGKKRSN